MEMYERASVLSADMAEDMNGADLQGTERGDDVVVIETITERAHLHLRRGMDASEVAEGLRALADTLDDT